MRVSFFSKKRAFEGRKKYFLIKEDTAQKMGREAVWMQIFHIL